MPAAKDKVVNIAQKIRHLRLYRDISQVELAEKIGAFPQQVCNYEKGRKVPSIHTLPKLADALGVTVDFLVREEDDSEITNQISTEKFAQILKQVDTMSPEIRKMAFQVLEAIINNYKLQTMVRTEAM